MEQAGDEIVVPVISEELSLSTREVTTGGVRITKRVVGHEEILEQQLRRERVEVRRVHVGRQVDGPQAVRETGATIIVPIVEETLRVEKVWVLKEELHITKVDETVPHRESVIVNHEEATVERLNQYGEVVAGMASPTVGSTQPLSFEEPPPLSVKAGSILERGDTERAENTHLGQNSILRRK